MKSREKTIQRKILSFLENRRREGKLFYARTGAGSIFIPASTYTKKDGSKTVHRGRKFTTGTKGIPDVYILIKGRTIWAEIKDDDGEVSDDQKKVHKELENHGAEVLIVRDELAFVSYIGNILGVDYS